MKLLLTIKVLNSYYKGSRLEKSHLYVKIRNLNFFTNEQYKTQYT